MTIDARLDVAAVSAADELVLENREVVVLAGARAPATGARCAIDAAERSAELVLGREVGIDRCEAATDEDGAPAEGPTVAYVVVEDRALLAQILIAEGWLTADDTRPCSEGVISTYDALEAEARAAGRGIHGPNCREDPSDLGLVRIVPSESSFDAPGQDLDNLEEEYVTLVSLGGNRDLTGWKLSNQLGQIYEFPSFVLSSGDFVRVRTGRGVDDADDLYWNLGVEAWNDIIGDRVTLVDDDGILVDSVNVPGG